MACLITSGRLEACKNAVGGIYKVWFANFGTITPTLSSDNYITSLSAATLYEYELKGVSNLAQSLQSSRENGTTICVQTLTLDLKNVDQKTNNELLLMAYGRPNAIIQYNDGTAFLAGKDWGFELTTGEQTSGANVGEKVGYTITLVANEKAYANQLSGSTFANAFAGMTIAPTIVKGT